MQKKKTLLITGIVLIVLIATASVLYGALGGDEGTGSAMGQSAAADDAGQSSNAEQDGDASQNEDEDKVTVPDFTVYDIDGNEVKLSDFRGKPVVLNFWASWCGPCKREMPDFDAKCKELDGEVQFLMVNVTDGSQETVESASSFIAEQGYQFPVFYDTAMEASSTYGATSLPMTFFIDAEGYGIARAVGAIDAATLQQGLDMILK